MILFKSLSLQGEQMSVEMIKCKNGRLYIYLFVYNSVYLYWLQLSSGQRLLAPKFSRKICRVRKLACRMKIEIHSRSVWGENAREGSESWNYSV